MSSQDDDFPSVGYQKANISAKLNSTVLFLYLIGIYTGVYGATITIYFRRKNVPRAHRLIVMGALTLLYGILAVETYMNWFYTSINFILGDTRVAIFLAGETDSAVPIRIAILVTFLEVLGFVIADALMVWRCVHACAGALRILIIPVGFFTFECALAVVNITILTLTYVNPVFQSDQWFHNANVIDGIFEAIVAATSISASVTISYHIYSITSRTSGAWRRYKHIVDILVQSSGAYSTAVLLAAVVDFLNTGEANTSLTALILDNYAETLYVFLTGLAPTLMVARLALASPRKEEETVLESVPTSLLSTSSQDGLEAAISQQHEAGDSAEEPLSIVERGST
ncbi:hypothetical protein D9613_008977 [Agrocybe pediades]|uniref:Uncharacterized protein n=1 Tax=Agrocybe pediades TaxID=84607 RepID=A0A8H4R337_9AGAR|nr:hypothetical protein D9613_008977 [Agrocybe pediades]